MTVVGVNLNREDLPDCPDGPGGAELVMNRGLFCWIVRLMVLDRAGRGDGRVDNRSRPCLRPVLNVSEAMVDEVLAKDGIGGVRSEKAILRFQLSTILDDLRGYESHP